jgi:hypothetical protein
LQQLEHQCHCEVKFHLSYLKHMFRS